MKPDELVVSDGTVSYIIDFLLGGCNSFAVPYVSYGYSDTALVVIEPSGFFRKDVYLTDSSLPDTPLAELRGIPVLFGEAAVCSEGERTAIKADLIASSYFLLTRYEECVRRDVRDKHGRFPGRESLPFREGFIRRAIVDEYGALLRSLLRDRGVNVKEPPAGYQSVFLTHDVDSIWTWENLYRASRSTVKRLITNAPWKLQPLQAVLNYRKHDPVSTFGWLVEQDSRVIARFGDSCHPVYFLMGCDGRTEYDDGYFRKRERVERLTAFLIDSDCELGWHVSYGASTDHRKYRGEIRRIESLTNIPVTKSRNHYLASREPEDFRFLIAEGITDEFSMAYADVAGFRLGTTRPVRWIDPITCTVTPLTLHHLTVMECTLDAQSYMAISDVDEAYSVVCELLDEVFRHGGEVTLLWHSPSVHPSANSYQRELYSRVLGRLLKQGDK